MSNTKTTPKKSTAIELATSRIAEAEAKHAALLAEVSTAEENVGMAEAELRRIEQCIAAGDPSAGLEELTKADTALRFYKVQTQAKAGARREAEASLRLARTAHVMARLEAGDYGIDMDGLRAEGEALASSIAAELDAYKATCEAHNAAVRQLWTDLAGTDAHNTDNGGGNPASPLAYGHEGSKSYNSKWITVDGVTVPVILDLRIDQITKRVEWIRGHGEEVAAEYAVIV